MTAHAKLSASGSKKWLTCMPSAALEDQFPDEQSEFAEEGTFAHHLGEHRLQKKLKLPLDYKKPELIPGYDKWYTKDLSDHVDIYVNIAMEHIKAAKAECPDALVLLEQKLDFSRWVPEGFGTGDVVIVADVFIQVIDLKFGKGIVVEAKDNSQMRLYGAGAYNEYNHLYDIDEVRMTICQPRVNNHDTEVITAAELLAWADEQVKPRADIAWAHLEGLPAIEYVPGEHCSSGFCRARFTCRARAEENLKMAQYEFKPADLLSVEEVGQILQTAGQLQKWAGEIQDWAREQAEQHHVRIPGWKLVEGRSNRVIADIDFAVRILNQNGYSDAIIYKPRQLLGISELEKVLGKKEFTAVLGDVIAKPQGKPVLVPDTDKRPELDSPATDFQPV